MEPNHFALPPDTDKLLAYQHLDRLNVSNVCDWALGALEAGFDTEAVRMLASISLAHEPCLDDARPYLAKALQELQISQEQSTELILSTFH